MLLDKLATTVSMAEARLVSAEDRDAAAAARQLRGSGGDQVVGLPALVPHRVEAHAVDYAWQLCHAALHLFWRLLPVSLRYSQLAMTHGR